MANGLYVNYKNTCLGDDSAAHGHVDLDTDTIKVGIVSGADYTENLATHQDWDDVGAYTLNASYNGETNQTLSNISISAGAVDNTADITFSAVAIDGAKDVDALVHYKDSGVIGTSPLICFHDGFTAVTPNGGDIVIQYNASGIYAL